MWLRNKPENKPTCLFCIFYQKGGGLSDFLILMFKGIDRLLGFLHEAAVTEESTPEI